MKSAIFLRTAILISLVFMMTEVISQISAAYRHNIVDSIVKEDGRVAYAIRVPGIPPADGHRMPAIVHDRASHTIPMMPAFDWSFGCSATSAAMMAGHYDNFGYPNMYVGPTNNGVMPMDNSSWPDTVIAGQTRHNCPLSATSNGLDGRTTAGHVDDYWRWYGAPGPDPWTVAGGGSGVQHTYGLCTGDYMKTNQWINAGEGRNTDGSTVFWTWNNGSPMDAADMESEGIDDEDGCYGWKLFYESRGYTVVDCFNQQIEEEGLPDGFSFDQYKAYIDAGKPVMIQVTDHSMVGYGYNEGPADTIYIHDTWDYSNHKMVWAGTYGGLQHYGVAVVTLQASTINVWDGSLNNYWGNAANWSLGHVPTNVETVVIPDLNTPVIIDVTDKVAGSLNVYPGATLRIMGYRLTITNDLTVGGTVEFNHNDGVLSVGDDIYWQDGSSLVTNTTTDFAPVIYVYGDWENRDGSSVNFTNGVVDFQGTSTSWIRQQSAGCNFNNIRDNKSGGAYLAISGTSTSEMLVEGNIYMYAGTRLTSYSNYDLTINGFLNNMNGNITMEAGTLKFNGNPSIGLKMNTGDYLNNLLINSGAYTLQLDNTYSNEVWLKGSMNIQSGYLDANAMTIKVDGNWSNAAGTSHFLEETSRVIFQGSGNQWINGDENFNILEINTVGQIRVISPSYDVVCSYFDWTAGGIYVSAGSFTANELSDNGIFGSYTLYSGGIINLNQSVTEWIDLNANLYIYGGTMNIYGGSGSSYWGFTNDITLNISGGVVDFKNNGIYLSSAHTITENITGGTIRTVGGFGGGSRTDFHPSGGDFEFYGTVNQNLTLGDNSFYNVNINKNATTSRKAEPYVGYQVASSNDESHRKISTSPQVRANTIFLGDTLTLTGNLTITSGVLDITASNFLIELAGNWTNNVGDAGFLEREGKVVFYGSTLSDIVTDETFYDLEEDKSTTSIYALESGTGNNTGVDIIVLRDLTITDGSFELNSPCNLTVGEDIYIESGATLNANDASPMNINVGLRWIDANAGPGGFDAGSYSVVNFNSGPTTSVQSVREASYFNDIIINSESPYIRPNVTPGYIHCKDLTIIDGTLQLTGYDVVVDDTLYNADRITMNNAADTLEVGFIVWQPGSIDNISAGKIFVSRDWIWENGTNATITSGNTVYFTGSTTGYIKSFDPDARFYNMEVNKSGSTLWIYSTSTEPVHVNNNLTVGASSLFHVQVGDLLVDGIADVVSTATMRLYSGGSVTLAGDFLLNGYVDLNGGGDFLIHGSFSQANTGQLDLDPGSTFVADMAYSASREFFNLAGTFNMQGGTFEVTNNHLNIQSTFVENITGGTIRIGGTLLASAGVFTPAGGTVEFITFSAGGTPYFDLHTGNWFHNLTISANTRQVYDVQNLYIKGDLLIQGGALDAGNDVIYLADDWTNTVGPSGFIEGTSTVYLNGTSALDQQTIFGETFYNLVNMNTARHVDIAGNTVVTNNFNVGAGGNACNVLVTASSLEVQNQLNLQAGTLALSASAPTVTVASMSQGGTLQVTDGTFTANDLADNFIGGEYTLYNGTINLYQDVSQLVDLRCGIEIQNGTFNIYSGYTTSYWPWGGSGSLTMSGGILDFKDANIRFSSVYPFSEDITGGIIRTARSLYSSSGVTFFTPEGGTFEFNGAIASTLALQPGCHFHDLKINKNSGVSVTAASDVPINNTLDVAGGTFNTGVYEVTVGTGASAE